MASERARERTVHRYYQSWLESSVGYRAVNVTDGPQGPHRFHLDGTSLRASNDRALIAFAQLGCLRLNAKRGIVTLLSTTRQYILAEATKTISLRHDHNDHDLGDELWFGNAALPRSQGISEHALTPDLYTAIGPDGAERTAPALVINDITLESKYSRHAYGGNGVNFYCGVPIISNSGFPIGVYTVSDDKPRNGLLPQELQFMQDMAVVVMDHLETVKNDSARFRGERLVLGLGHFVKGESTFYEDQRRSSNSPIDTESDKVYIPTDDAEKTAVRFKGMNITDANPGSLSSRETLKKDKLQRPSTERKTLTTLKSVADEHADSADGVDSENKQQNGEPVPKSSTVIVLEGQSPANTITSSQSQEVEQVFSRAANILRECAAADGVVFYDAVSSNFAKGPGTSNYVNRREPSDDAAMGSGSSDSSMSTDRSSTYSERSTSVSSGFSESGQPLHILSSRGKRSRMLGYSLDISSESTATVNTIKTLGLNEKSLRRLIRRYPQGKMFHFTEDGEASSESDQSISSQRGRSAKRNAHNQFKEGKSPNSSQSITEELIQIVPGARSVMWLPLWDFTKQRWSAGTFLWSRQAEKLLSAQEDLTYLSTFGSCIMGEIARLEALSADTARTTFIANISHELRSPLHGILGSIEFLQDTPLDAFQSSMTTAVETCGKTLLDTVDHVLDYAKINDLSRNHSRKKKVVKRRQNWHGSTGRKKDESTLDDDFDLAVVVEEVIEAVYAGQTFRGGEKVDKKHTQLLNSHSHSDDSPETTRILIQRGSTKFSGAVRVILSIEKHDSWWVYGQPGAVRRIVMNIFGNALKYTDEGTIKVTLRTDVQTVSSSRIFCITVTDTGIGMAPEFLHNHAFTAFTQESSFSAGAGLGLNIVRQIVNSLGGKIEVFSERGVGTEVKVWLTMPKAHSPPTGLDTDDLLLRVAQKTSGQSLCILNPHAENVKEREKASDPAWLVESALQDLAEQWFGMRTMTERSMEDVSADFFVYAEPPPIEYLLEHHGIHARSTEIPVIIMATNAFESASLSTNGIHQLTDIGSVVEVMAQPCGPQKLAKILHRAMTRLASLVRDPESQHTTDAANTDVVEDSRTSDSYLGDSDSEQPVEFRLKRNHSDHPQPEQDGTGTSDSTANGDGGKSDHRNPPLILKHSGPSEAANGGPQADQQELEATLSPQTSRPMRPPMLRRSTAATSSTGMTDFDRPASPYSPNPEAPRILLVDDNDINLQLLVAFMRKAKLPFEACKNGLEALHAYQRAATILPNSKFKHVLMDVSMPVMDGITSTNMIRQFEKRESLQPANIIAVTGQASEATREELFKAGGDTFLTKPVKFKELMRLLNS